MPGTLTTNHTERFAADGYLVLPDLIPQSTVDRVRSDARALLATLVHRMVATCHLEPRVTWWRLDTGRPYVLKIKPVTDLVPSVRALALHPQLTGTAAELLGTAACLMEDKIMYKQTVNVPAAWANLPTLGEEVCKHTDAAYFAARGYPHVLTVAVCLDECTAETGALRVWPGTHRRRIPMMPTEHQGPVVPDDAAPDSDAVTLTASPGSVLMWDAALVHASGPNTSRDPRRLVVLGYAPTTEPS
jgi:Phytanoyl-CoA dioxygenase (PhyH)